MSIGPCMVSLGENDDSPGNSLKMSLLMATTRGIVPRCCPALSFVSLNFPSNASRQWSRSLLRGKGRTAEKQVLDAIKRSVFRVQLGQDSWADTCAWDVKLV